MKDYFKNNLFTYNRRKSIPVKIGNIGIGGDNPIRIQSMTTTDTMDTNATVEQSIRMIEAGCEYVRITAPSIKEAIKVGHKKAILHFTRIEPHGHMPVGLA